MLSMPGLRSLATIRIDEFPNLVWVQIEDEEGVIGLGETFLGAAAVETYLHTQVAPKLRTRNVGDIDPIRLALQHYTGFNSSGVEVRGNSAVDIALWDLLGKRMQLPLWQLLGGRHRDAIRTYNTCAGYRYIRSDTGQHSTNWGVGESARPYEDLAAFSNDAGALAEDLLSQGISGMKIWPFDRYAERSQGQSITPDELDEGLEPFRKIRKAVGDRMQIMLECHGLWSLPVARDIVRAVKPFDIFWIEDAVRADSFEALRELRSACDIKITASETLAGRHQFCSLMRNSAVDIVMPDISWCGGLSEARAIAAIADSFHLPIAPHDCTGPVTWMASCHLAMHASNTLIQESVRAFYSGWYTEVGDALPLVKDGYISLREGVGLGQTLRADRLNKNDVTITTSDLT